MKIVLWLIKSSKTELKIVLATLAVLILLPLVSVVVFASAGLSVISSALASVNPITHLVDLFDPDGNKIAEVKLSTVWPARGYVSDEFGSEEAWRRAIGLGVHTGIDIANEYHLIGGPITPFMPGKVVKVDYDGGDACGIYVKIQHEYNIQSLYCHMSTALAFELDEVKPGDIIGLVGSTGKSSGPHLHFQIEIYGIPVNPRTFMVGEPERNLPGALF